jgi:ribonuclease P protein component
MRERAGPAKSAGARFGFTITKKIGNAVTRNRIRRRLKAAFAARAGEYGKSPCDYVVVARHAALDRPYALLLDDVARALLALHGKDRQRQAGGMRAASIEAAGKKGST